MEDVVLLEIICYFISYDSTFFEIEKPREVICLLRLIQAFMVTFCMLQLSHTSISLQVYIRQGKLSQDALSVSDCDWVTLIHFLVSVWHTWIYNLDPYHIHKVLFLLGIMKRDIDFKVKVSKSIFKSWILSIKPIASFRVILCCSFSQCSKFSLISPWPIII